MLAKLTLVATFLLLLGHSVVTEMAKDMWALTKEWGRFDLPRVQYSSAVVQRQPELPDVFYPTATVANDDFRDAKGIEMLVAAPEACVLGEPASQTWPSGIDPLMHIVSKHVQGRPNILLVTIGFMGKNQRLMLGFPVTCFRDIPRFRLQINLSNATCTP